MQKTLENCKKCNSKISGNYCSNCGQPVTLKRINQKYILNEIGSVLNFDKGIFYTIKELLIRPGETVKKFIVEDRNRLVKPVIFIIISSLIYTVLTQIFQFEDGYVNFKSSTETATTSIFTWVQNNYGYANILMGIFIAFWIKLLFRKYDYNFYEILILLCFLMGIGMLLYAVFGIIESLTQFKILHIGGFIGFLYISWAIGQFFGKKNKVNYIKAFLAYLLGMITFSLAAVALGFLIDLIKQ